MKMNSTKWLKLQLENKQTVASKYTIVHTHFSIYSYLLDQGFTLAVYQPVNHDREVPNGVMYVQTDHEGFYKSCLKNYATEFLISGMEADFAPDRNFQLMCGRNLSLSA